MRPRQRRALAQWAQAVHGLSERHAARLIAIPRMTLRYQHHRDPQEGLRVRLRELAASRVRYGYRRLTVLLKREGWAVNAKRIYLLYSEEGLMVRTTQRKKRAQRPADTSGISHMTQSEVEHGFRCPAAGRRPLDSGTDGSRPGHARVLGVVRGCLLKWGESRSCVGRDYCRSRCAAIHHGR